MRATKNHQELNNKGEGLCSVPMWYMGIPAGFCDNIAYGFETEKHKQLMKMRREFQYIPGLACPSHGGPTKEQAVNLCTTCRYHPAECKGVPKFGTGAGNDNVYECNSFELTQEDK